MTSIVREPTVLPLAKIGDGDRHIIVRTILRNGQRQTQAMSLRGEWLDRPEGFEADPEVTFTRRPVEPTPEQVSDVEAIVAAIANGALKPKKSTLDLSHFSSLEVKHIEEALMPAWERFEPYDEVIVSPRVERTIADHFHDEKEQELLNQIHFLEESISRLMTDFNEQKRALDLHRSTEPAPYDGREISTDFGTFTLRVAR